VLAGGNRQIAKRIRATELVCINLDRGPAGLSWGVGMLLAGQMKQPFTIVQLSMMSSALVNLGVRDMVVLVVAVDGCLKNRQLLKK